MGIRHLIGFLSVGILHASSLFLLPDESHTALHTLERTVASARERLLVITPRLESPALRKALSEAAARHVAITLAVSPSTPTDGAYLAQFDQVDVLTVEGLHSDETAGSLSLTLIVADDTTACLSTIPFDERRFRHDAALLACYDSPDTVTRCLEAARPLLARSKPYLH